MRVVAFFNNKGGVGKTSLARKPMFALEPADGAIGGHTRAVRDCHRDFRALAGTILDRTGGE